MFLFPPYFYNLPLFIREIGRTAIHNLYFNNHEVINQYSVSHLTINILNRYFIIQNNENSKNNINIIVYGL